MPKSTKITIFFSNSNVSFSRISLFYLKNFYGKILVMIIRIVNVWLSNQLHYWDYFDLWLRWYVSNKVDDLNYRRAYSFLSQIKCSKLMFQSLLEIHLLSWNMNLKFNTNRHVASNQFKSLHDFCQIQKGKEWI